MVVCTGGKDILGHVSQGKFAMAVEFEHEMSVSQMNLEEGFQFIAPIIACVGTQIGLRLFGGVDSLKGLSPIVRKLQGYSRLRVLKNHPPISCGKSITTIGYKRRCWIIVLPTFEVVANAVD